MHVAIVGAGFSGLVTAYLLESKGHRVTVFEKEALPGGHCNTLLWKDNPLELGTVFCIPGPLKQLLDKLGIAYSERMSNRSFLDIDLNPMEQVPRQKIGSLIQELNQLLTIMDNLQLNQGPMYGEIPPPLLASFYDFCTKYELLTLYQAIAPHLCAFGFSPAKDLPAYYALSIFDSRTVNAFIKGEKLLYIEKGFTEVIQRLTACLSDIRYNAPVRVVTSDNQGATLETPFEVTHFDYVFITAPLASDAFSHPQIKAFMTHLKRNLYTSCAYKIRTGASASTYLTGNFGKLDHPQFFQTFNCASGHLLVAYAYGDLSPHLVHTVTQALKDLGIAIEHLICAKSWRIFPHHSSDTLLSDAYSSLRASRANTRIWLTGSLVGKPAIASLYASAHETLQELETLSKSR